MSLTICSLYFLKVNHHCNFAPGYPWKLQIEFFMTGSKIFSRLYSAICETLRQVISRQFGFKEVKKISKKPQNRYRCWNFLFDLVTLTCCVFKGNKNKQANPVNFITKKSFFLNWNCWFCGRAQVKLKWWLDFKNV